MPDNAPMPNIHETLVRAISDHWKAHDNQYPQKIVLGTAQYGAFVELRRIGRLALGDDGPVAETEFMGVPLEQDASSPGALIAVDGSPVALASIDH